MTKKILVSEKFSEDVLRLRYGSTQPTSDCPPLFSLTCICRYLKAPLSSVRKVVCSYFKNMEKDMSGINADKKKRQEAL